MGDPRAARQGLPGASATRPWVGAALGWAWGPPHPTWPSVVPIGVRENNIWDNICTMTYMTQICDIYVERPRSHAIAHVVCCNIRHICRKKTHANKQTNKQENVHITAIQPMFNLWMSYLCINFSILRTN